MPEHNRTYGISEKLAIARPAIEADGPDPQGRRGYRRGYSGLLGDLTSDQPEFQTAAIRAEAALFDLDHRWWPKHREDVVELIQAARELERAQAPEPAEVWARLVRALAKLDSSRD